MLSVHIAIRGRHCAAREAARHVAAADEVGQLPGWSVAGFWWGLPGVDDAGDRGPYGGSAGDRAWNELAAHHGGGSQAGEPSRGGGEGFGEGQLAQGLGEHGWGFAVE